MDNIAVTGTVAETNSKTLRLRVITPMSVVYDKQVSMFIARTTNGDMGVLYGHESHSALLADWSLRIIEDEQDKKEELLMVLGGILTVRENDAVIMSDMAEYPEKMQALIEKIKAEKAESKIKNQNTDLHTQRMELAIRQALVQIDVSAYSIIKENTPPEK